MATLSTLKRQLETEEKRLRDYERDANFLHHMSYAGLSPSQTREQSGLKRKLTTAYKKLAKLKAQIAAAEAKQNPHQLRVQKIVAGRMVKGKFVRGNPGNDPYDQTKWRKMVETRKLRSGMHIYEHWPSGYRGKVRRLSKYTEDKWSKAQYPKGLWNIHTNEETIYAVPGGQKWGIDTETTRRMMRKPVSNLCGKRSKR